MSKGSGRRPTDTAHALRCDRVGHWPVGRSCFRCGEPVAPPQPPMVPDPEYVTQTPEET